MRLPAASASTGGCPHQLLLVRSPYACSSRYALRHIWARSFKKGLNIFHNAGANCVLTVLSPAVCRMPVNMASDCFNVQTDFWQSHSLLPERGTRHSSSTERAIPSNLAYPKARHIQRVAVQVPPTQARGGQRSQVTCTRICWPVSPAELVMCYWQTLLVSALPRWGGCKVCISKLNSCGKKHLPFTVLNHE